MKRTMVMILAAGLLCVYGCGKKTQPLKLSAGALLKTVKTDAAKVEREYGVRVGEAVLCRNVENRKPVDAAESFSTDSQIDVYFFTRITGRNPSTKVYHRFCRLVEGLSGPFWKEIYKKELSIESTNYRTWTYKTVFPGFWRADLIGPDGTDIMKSVVFRVEGPERTMTKAPANPSAKSDNLTLLETITCEDVKDAKPVNPGESFVLAEETDSKPVWVWLHCKADRAPSAVYLRWSTSQQSVDGAENWVPAFIQKLAIGGKEWRTFAWSNCAEGVTRLDIIGPDGTTVLKTVNITVGR